MLALARDTLMVQRAEESAEGAMAAEEEEGREDDTEQQSEEPQEHEEKIADKVVKIKRNVVKDVADESRGTTTVRGLLVSAETRIFVLLTHHHTTVIARNKKKSRSYELIYK